MAPLLAPRRPLPLAPSAGAQRAPRSGVAGARPECIWGGLLAFDLKSRKHWGPWPPIKRPPLEHFLFIYREPLLFCPRRGQSLFPLGFSLVGSSLPPLGAISSFKISCLCALPPFGGQRAIYFITTHPFVNFKSHSPRNNSPLRGQRLLTPEGVSSNVPRLPPKGADPMTAWPRIPNFITTNLSIGSSSIDSSQDGPLPLEGGQHRGARRDRSLCSLYNSGGLCMQVQAFGPESGGPRHAAAPPHISSPLRFASGHCSYP